MSIIKHHPFVSRFQGTPTSYVVHLRGGAVAHQGVGQAFWFRPTVSALSEVPVSDQELPVIFHAYTVDHQDVTVQITATYRFADPALASQRLDFGVFPRRSCDGQDGETQAAAILTRLAQSLVVADIAARPLDQVVGNVQQTHTILAGGFAGDQRLRGTGIEVVDLHVLAIRPETEMEKALQTPLREQIQAEADKATFERRALAVERERAISENELASKIELATRTEQLVAQEGANARRTAEEESAAALIKAEGDAERRRLSSEAEAAAKRLTTEAEAAGTAALMAAYADANVEALKALALRDLAAELPALSINQLTITPDLLSKALARLGA